MLHHILWSSLAKLAAISAMAKEVISYQSTVDIRNRQFSLRPVGTLPLNWQIWRYGLPPPRLPMAVFDKMEDDSPAAKGLVLQQRRPPSAAETFAAK